MGLELWAQDCYVWGPPCQPYTRLRPRGADFNPLECPESRPFKLGVKHIRCLARQCESPNTTPPKHPYGWRVPQKPATTGAASYILCVFQIPTFLCFTKTSFTFPLQGVSFHGPLVCGCMPHALTTHSLGGSKEQQHLSLIGYRIYCTMWPWDRWVTYQYWQWPASEIFGEKKLLGPNRKQRQLSYCITDHQLLFTMFFSLTDSHSSHYNSSDLSMTECLPHPGFKEPLVALMEEALAVGQGNWITVGWTIDWRLQNTDCAGSNTTWASQYITNSSCQIDSKQSTGCLIAWYVGFNVLSLCRQYIYIYTPYSKFFYCNMSIFCPYCAHTTSDCRSESYESHMSYDCKRPTAHPIHVNYFIVSTRPMQQVTCCHGGWGNQTPYNFHLLCALVRCVELKITFQPWVMRPKGWGGLDKVWGSYMLALFQTFELFEFDKLFYRYLLAT